MMNLMEWNYLRVENFLSKRFDLGKIQTSNVPAFIDDEKMPLKTRIYIKGSKGNKELDMNVERIDDRYVVDFS